MLNDLIIILIYELIIILKLIYLIIADCPLLKSIYILKFSFNIIDSSKLNIGGDICLPL